MRIRQADIEKILGPMLGDQADLKASLFIVSPKNQRLKKLNLAHLTSSERKAKLQKWGLEKRFVAVIETGDMVFAHTYFKHASCLQLQEGLFLNGKKVTVKALTDEQTLQLSLIGEAFEETVVQKKKKEEKKDFTHASVLNVGSPYFFGTSWSGYQSLIPKLLATVVKNDGLSKIMLKGWQLYNEAQREERKQKEANDKHLAIIRSEIDKEILKNEIQSQELKRSVTGIYSFKLKVRI